jgi:hypothetical protein
MTDGDGTHTYAYDGLYRLTEATHPADIGLPEVERFTYDKVGNREDPNSDALWEYDGNNRLIVSPETTFEYDLDGNQTTRGGSATLDHDGYNRLRRYSAEIDMESYLYDSGGRRIEKTGTTYESSYLWDGSTLIAEYDRNSATHRIYASLPSDFAPVQARSEQPAIPNLPLLLASAATWRWLRGLQGIHHGVEQVLPGSEGEVECQRTQVFEEGLPR